MLSVTNEKGNLMLTTIEKFPSINISVETNAVSNITQSTATCYGAIDVDDVSILDSSGICYDISAVPTVDSYVVYTSDVSDSFLVNVVNLTPNTTYYFRAFAKTPVGTFYGDSISGQTLSVNLPTVTNIESYEYAYSISVSGSIDFGGDPNGLSNYGIVVSETNNTPTINEVDCITTFGNASIDNNVQFSIEASALQANTQYYVRLFATNSSGTSHSTTLVLSTILDEALISTDGYQDYYDTLGLYGSYTSFTQGVTSRGFLISDINTTPLIDDISGTTIIQENTTEQDARFTITTTLDAESDTTYYYRAFVIENGNAFYGDVLEYYYDIQE